MKKPWVKIAAIVAALFVLVVLVIPFFVNADTFRPTLENQLSSALGRKVTLGHLSFSLITGSLVANDIAIADDPAFSTSPFLEATSFHIGVHIAPLLFHHQVEITRLLVAAPSINLIHVGNGKWNFSSLGGATASPSPQQQTAIPDLTVGELKIENGTAAVSTNPPTRKPLVYTAINLAVQQFSFSKSFPFQLSAKLPGDGSVDLTGTGGPFNSKNAADTPFQASLQVKHFDPVAAGVLDPGQGISMLVDTDAHTASDGTTLTSTGKIQADRLQLARTGSPAPHPVDIDYAMSDHLDTSEGQVSDLAVHTGSVVVHVKGGFHETPQAILLDLHLSAPNLPVDQLEQLLPVVGIHLPSGSSLHGGTLTATLAISGPATATTIAGPVEIDNTQLAGFDLGSRIQGINPFGGKGGGTAIQTLRTDVNNSPQGTQFTNIYGNLPQIGTASGNGTVSPSGALDFKMVAKFNPASGVGAVAGKAMNAVTGAVGNAVGNAGAVGGMLGGFLHSKAKPAAGSSAAASAGAGAGGIPITITGTASNPSIHANLLGMFK
jgi:AsmA protein